MKTEIVKKKFMTLLPPNPGVCQECAVAHEPEMPHNAQSLYYQTKFNMAHGRGATWKDAMEHCSKEMKADWIKALKEKGVDLKAGKVNPEKVNP